MQTTFITTNPQLLAYDSPLLLIQIIGGIKISNSSLDRMRITAKIQSKTEKHQPPVRLQWDAYNADATERIIRRLAEQFSLELTEVRLTLNDLIEQLETYRFEQLNSLNQPKQQKVELTEEEKSVAIKYLKQKNLLEHINKDLAQFIVGEEVARLLLYIIMSSRKMQRPISSIIFGNAGDGKSHLMHRIKEVMPPEEVITVSTMTKNALYYYKSEDLNEKVICIEDYFAASDEVLYTLRQLQSEQCLSKSYAIKNQSGVMETAHQEIKARVSVVGCSNKSAMIEDNLSRALNITLQTNDKQDAAIMDSQRLSAIRGNQSNPQQKELVKKLQNIQRILNAEIKILNPLAAHLSLPTGVKNKRRSMALYLDFIAAITFLHQYQREITTDKTTGDKFISTTKEDIRIANDLLKDVLLRKADDLSIGARKMLEAIKVHLNQNNKQEFTQKELRFALLQSNDVVKRHIKELLESTYLKVMGGNRFKGITYSLLSDEEYTELQNNISVELNQMLMELSK